MFLEPIPESFPSGPEHIQVAEVAAAVDNSRVPVVEAGNKLLEVGGYGYEVYRPMHLR